MHIDGTGFSHLEISYKKWCNHYASSPHLSKVKNLDSIVDHAIIICLEDFQDIVALAKVNAYLLVDFESFILNAQFASLYPLGTNGYHV